MSVYTAISFAPVQGFIEKSRKLRDLSGASGILSYLSFKLIETAKQPPHKCEVISPGLINVQEGMPNRILLKGEFSRNDVTNTLLSAWKAVLDECRTWIENKLEDRFAKEEYNWEKEWLSWGMYSWEIFWGHGDCPEKAMKELETRKLRRDWTAINWIGESSSLTGTDAIAWPDLGIQDSNPGRRLTEIEKKEIKDFYQCLSCILENLPLDGKPEGKFLAPNEKLSIPELVKRLVTRDDIARKIGICELKKGFSEIARMPEEGMATGRWTGWFMGDGDKVGEKIKNIYESAKDEGVKSFSHAIRDWGREFKDKFPKCKGRVVYAGGDDFLGVIYRDKFEKPVNQLEAMEWLIELPAAWKELQEKVKQLAPNINVTFSVGFVWAAHSVPQRDILQHCREAEKRAKNLGRDRVTIRVVFNSGQYVQWTCPWNYLHILKKYTDRDGKTWGEKPNWSHVYTDLAQLKSHHAINLDDDENNVDERLALALFDIYFNDKDFLEREENCQQIVGDYSTKELPKQIIHWINDLINIGWQLCSNT